MQVPARHAQRIVHFRDGRLVKDENVEEPLDARQLLEEWLHKGGLE
ncbi:MAG TPA: hypothetical protein VN426_04795 [Syntrophomonadaceae bacterium]|nr:hypothetical protein [Syntrophomonadaceae bacterium]